MQNLLGRDRFVEKHELPKLIQDKIQNLIRRIYLRNWIDKKILPPKETPGPVGFISERRYHTFKEEEILPISHKVFQKIEEEEMLSQRIPWSQHKSDHKIWQSKYSKREENHKSISFIKTWKSLKLLGKHQRSTSHHHRVGKDFWEGIWQITNRKEQQWKLYLIWTKKFCSLRGIVSTNNYT